jgi:hypothetical protein
MSGGMDAGRTVQNPVAGPNDESRHLCPGSIAPRRPARGARRSAPDHRPHPTIDLTHWFTQHPFIESATGKSWVLSNQWDTRTPPALEALDQAFAGKGVTYQEAAT